MKPRKIIPRILGLTALAALIGAWAVFGPLVKGALSLQKLDEGIYYMEFRGDDGFEGLLESGGGSDAAEISPRDSPTGPCRYPPTASTPAPPSQSGIRKTAS